MTNDEQHEDPGPLTPEVIYAYRRECAASACHLAAVELRRAASAARDLGHATKAEEWARNAAGADALAARLMS